MLGGRDISVAYTGIGPKRARDALESIAPLCAGGVIVNVGIAGALTDELSIGEWREIGTVAMDAPAAGPVRANLAGAHERAVLVTSEGGITNSAAALALAEKHDAALVDMEAYVIARFARHRKLRCHILKMVSDRADRNLTIDMEEALEIYRETCVSQVTRLLRRLRSAVNSN